MGSILPLAILLSTALADFAPQQAGSEPLEPALEARVQKLGKTLRCAVCQGLSISDSPASMARAQLDKVRALVSEGKSDEEIRDYFVARYGEWVLLQPEAHGINWLVWLGPVALLLIGFVVIARQLQKKPSAAPQAKTEQEAKRPAPAEGDEDEYLARVRAELER